MDKTFYKTQPRLFILGMTFLGFAFFGLLFLLTLQGIQDECDSLVISVLLILAFFSVASLFYFINIKTIKLTKDNVVISYLLLPIKRTLNYTEIRNMEQTEKVVKAVYGNSWKASYIYTDITTLIHLAEKKTIKLNSIGQLDFDELYKTFTKLKHGEGKIKEQRRHFLLYLIDNVDGLVWIILLLILTIVLGYGIFSK